MHIFVYFAIVLLFYLSLIEPVLEKIIKKDLVLNHFWIPHTEIIRKKDQKIAVIAAYLLSIAMIITVTYQNPGFWYPLPSESN